LASVDEAAIVANISASDVALAFFALAGDDVVDDHLKLHSMLTDAVDGMPFDLANDVWAGLRAGSIDGTGIAVNCGSGTGAVGKRLDGAGVIIPDLGYAFGDSGGGTQIGIDAIRAVIRAWDGRGSPTALSDAVLKLTGLPFPEALYLALYRNELGADINKQCTRLVFQIAATGDDVAQAILSRIGDEIGVSGCAIARRMGVENQAFPFVLTGGAIRTLNSVLVDAAVERMKSVAPRCVPTLPKLMPVAGAALLALEAAEVPVTSDHFARLRSQGQAWHPEENFA
jgi:N-acetylglucosamine kinase-like BadF-type ATPase